MKFSATCFLFVKVFLSTAHAEIEVFVEISCILSS